MPVSKLPVEEVERRVNLYIKRAFKDIAHNGFHRMHDGYIVDDNKKLALMMRKLCLCYDETGPICWNKNLEKVKDCTVCLNDDDTFNWDEDPDDDCPEEEVEEEGHAGGTHDISSGKE